MTTARKLFLISVIAYLFSPAINRTSALSTSSDYDTLINRQARNASAFAQMLGEFRTSLGDMLFVKTERYLDSGIAYEPHIDAREMEASGMTAEQKMDSQLGTPEMASTAAIKPGRVAVEDSHEHHEHSHGDHDHAAHGAHDDHGNVKTIIRTAHTDFRGFIGKMEREVKPWRDPSKPHQHTAGTELLPWYRLATITDPHNVRNYMIGAWWLKTLDSPAQLDEAIKFLDEGMAQNPQAYELPLMKGYVLRQLKRNEEARKIFSQSSKLALKERPPGNFVESPQWDTTDEEQMVAAMTMEINLTRDEVSTASALQLLDNYQKIFPDEGALKRIRMELEPSN